MTIEKRFVVGIEDIRSIVFQCDKCGGKVTCSPDKEGHIPYRCLQCAEAWRSDTQESPVTVLLQILAAMRKGIGHGFSVKFEFDAPTS